MVLAWTWCLVLNVLVYVSNRTYALLSFMGPCELSDLRLRAVPKS